MIALGNMLSELVSYFMLPVLVVLALMFCYSVMVLGGFLYELVVRTLFMRQVSVLTQAAAMNARISIAELEIVLFKELEGLRIVSRVAPMLGLAAAMIPMGPALLLVSSGDLIGMAEQLVVAFSGLIIALMSAAISYVVMVVRRRWLLSELTSLLPGSPRGSASLHTDGELNTGVHLRG